MSIYAQDGVNVREGDIDRYGGLSLLITNVLDVRTLGETGSPTNDAFRQLLWGLVLVAQEQEMVLYKGETAELGVCVGSEDEDAVTMYNWAATAIGVYHKDKMIIGDTLAEDLLFPLGLSAHLDDLWDPPSIMRECATWRGMSDRDVYDTWNGGQGALVVVSECEVEPYITLASSFGIGAKVCGRITKEATPRVTIISKFSGQEIVYES